MPTIMPSQVVVALERMFPHAVNNQPSASIDPSLSGKVQSLLDLVNNIPEQLIVLAPQDYAAFVQAKGTMHDTLATWIHRGLTGPMPGVEGFDAVTVTTFGWIDSTATRSPLWTSGVLAMSLAIAARERERRRPGRGEVGKRHPLHRLHERSDTHLRRRARGTGNTAAERGRGIRSRVPTRPTCGTLELFQTSRVSTRRLAPSRCHPRYRSGRLMCRNASRYLLALQKRQ